MINVAYLNTKRLRVAYRHVGETNARKMLFIHGNMSSSVCLEPLFPVLSQYFELVAPDLRCFGKTQALAIDATRGYRDWSDDVFSLVEELGWDSFVLAGWSMGGNVAMQFTIDHPELVEKLLLLCPGPPYGFGGTYGEEGKVHNPIGLGSGAGAAFPGLIAALENKSTGFMSEMLMRQFFSDAQELDTKWRNRLVNAMVTVSTGPGRFPGNYQTTRSWPHVVAGDKGVLNAMSSLYGRLTAFLEIDNKPPVLWIRGEQDRIVSDRSTVELGALGEAGVIPGWPGEEVYPPQPMVSQIRAFLKDYRRRGGSFEEVLMPGGHMCAQQYPDIFFEKVKSFLGV